MGVTFGSEERERDNDNGLELIMVMLMKYQYFTLCTMLNHLGDRALSDFMNVNDVNALTHLVGWLAGLRETGFSAPDGAGQCAAACCWLAQTPWEIEAGSDDDMDLG